LLCQNPHLRHFQTFEALFRADKLAYPARSFHSPEVLSQARLADVFRQNKKSTGSCMDTGAFCFSDFAAGDVCL
jgi:hypothetical protein